MKNHKNSCVNNIDYVTNVCYCIVVSFHTLIHMTHDVVKDSSWLVPALTRL